jgi:hypothetical protein
MILVQICKKSDESGLCKYFREPAAYFQRFVRCSVRCPAIVNTFIQPFLCIQCANCVESVCSGKSLDSSVANLELLSNKMNTLGIRDGQSNDVSVNSLLRPMGE